MEQLAGAVDEATARQVSDQLWGIWLDAPDATAQDVLETGLEQRASYNYTGALESFDRLVAYCPDYAEGYNQRAFIHFLRQDYEASLADLDRALAITPDHVGAVSGRALALARMGRERDSQIALRAALKLNPWLPERAFLKPLEDLPPGANGETDL
ncbi:MAG: tetratricopeptide repeat protein [Pseudomonadota bacterium]